jgi:hypothetical protein
MLKGNDFGAFNLMDEVLGIAPLIDYIGLAFKFRKRKRKKTKGKAKKKRPKYARVDRGGKVPILFGGGSNSAHIEEPDGSVNMSFDIYFKTIDVNSASNGDFL